MRTLVPKQDTYEGVVCGEGEGVDVAVTSQ